MDYFVFKRGLWPNIPDFAIGRMAWDSWLVGSQIDAAGVVVDATEAITAIHQDHRCGASTPRQREEETNRELAGAVAALGSAECAAWKITADGVVGRHAGEFVRIDNPSVAFTCLDRAYRQNPDRIKRQYEHFIHHVAAGKVRRVIEDAKMHLLAEPDNFAARFTLRLTGNQDAETAIGLFNKGLTALRASQVDQALTHLREALSYNVRVPNLHYTMAVAFGQMNDLGSAADACRKEVALYPDNKSAHELLQKITAAANRPRQSSRA
jgi:tetratricopeptide (TPR) repeat protein